jgi:diguanylate cyclase (GGDEF)-like protein
MELFGHARSERRRREERGIAFPILDGRQSVGALIVFGPPETLPADARETIMWHCVDAGPRIAAAWQTQVAERAMATDPTTRLLNAEAIARAADEWTEGSCAVAVLEITGFDRLLELGGPPLSAAALRHVSRILRESLREDDLPVRVDQSRFASWLPHTALGDARVVAERFAHGLRTRHLDWAGGTLALACRVGVAAYPETVSDPEDLLEAATEALAAPPAPAQAPAIT